MSDTVGRLLAAGNVAEVFEWDSQVVKLYRSPAAKPAAFREAAIHAAVEAMGIPVPAVWGVRQIGSRWGVVFDRVRHASFAEQMRGDPIAMPRYLERLAQLHTFIHAHPAPQLSSLKIRLATRMDRTELLDEPRKQVLLSGRAAMPEGDRLCHGDFHPINVLGELSRPVVIDWPDACRGDPAADVCRSYLLLKLHAEEIAEPYLEAYCRINNAPESSRTINKVTRRAILDWLPYVAAARLAENVPNDHDRLLKIVYP
jgi:aminoglycoside phosphotransferase (APT) family kinase protein